MPIDGQIGNGNDCEFNHKLTHKKLTNSENYYIKNK